MADDFEVHICGCGNGIDWTIIHVEDHKVKHISDDGQEAIVTFEKYKNVEGEIKTVYPNRAIIIYKNKEIEVPLINVAKK